MEGLTLGIDSSGAVSVAIASGEEVRAVRTDARARHHDEVLLGMIEDALAESGGTRADITRVVAGRGPGPFTGLRVGLVTARSIATVLDAELVGVSSLEALALEAAEKFTEANDVAVALDARRKEVYFAVYHVERGANGIELSERIAPAVAAPADAARVIGQGAVIVGAGAHLYPELLPPHGDIEHANAGHLIRAAAAAEARREDVSSTEPMYLRDADAAKPTRRKSALGLDDRAI